ncbi:hypothetical protein M0812_24800 [Anaeramoeba flamelloides]|uniref:EF-hand domain-containing protein n=1 Tax=Anaeramoeba flamelloides TaxID=1746091 RepID=A0AAV7YNF4_9EUKA|nr:hypothetical protein M0812_24800 [Anaeramoeba flamelloides]
MFKKQRPTNQQIAVQNILKYKVSKQNERKLDSVLSNASPLFTKLKQGFEKGSIEEEKNEIKPIREMSFNLRAKRIKSCIILNSPTKNVTIETKHKTKDTPKRSVKVVRSMKRRKNKFKSSSRNLNSTKPKNNCGNFTSHSQPNYRALQQNKLLSTEKGFFSHSQKVYPLPNHLSRDKLLKMMAMCPTYPVSKHKQKILLNSLTRKRAFLQNKSVSKRLRFNAKTMTNSKKLIQKDLFEQMILSNNNAHNNKHIQRTNNRGSYTLLNRHKPQLKFKRPKPTKKNYFKKKTQTNLKNEIFFNDPKKNQVIKTIPQDKVKSHLAKKKVNSPQKVKLLNYGPNTFKKRNKLLFVTKSINQDEFKKKTEYCKNNSPELELKKKQIVIETLKQPKTKLNPQSRHENENELIIKKKEKPRYFEDKNNTKIELEIIEKSQNLNYNFKKNPNILSLNGNYQNNESGKKTAQRSQIEINFHGNQDDFDFDFKTKNENGHKNSKEIPKANCRNMKNSKYGGDTNKSIINFDNNDNIYINTKTQPLNKLSVFENFQKDRQGSIEFPEFYRDFDKNQSFYQYFFENLFISHKLKKKNSNKKKSKIPKKYLTKMAKNPFKYTYSINDNKLITN